MVWSSTLTWFLILCFRSLCLTHLDSLRLFSRNFSLRLRRLRRSSSTLLGLERRRCFADKQFWSAIVGTGILTSRRLHIPLVASVPLAVWKCWLKWGISTGFAQGYPQKLYRIILVSTLCAKCYSTRRISRSRGVICTLASLTVLRSGNCPP